MAARPCSSANTHQSFELGVVLAKLVNEYIPPFLRVYVRVRPPLSSIWKYAGGSSADTSGFGLSVPSTAKSTNAVQPTAATTADEADCTEISVRYCGHGKEEKCQSFSCHCVFWEQPHLPVFNTVKESLEDVLYGRSVSILCYGMTGAGKSYTLLGPDVEPSPDALLLRTMEHILHRCDEENEQQQTLVANRALQYTCQVRMLVFDHGYKVRDLLREDHSSEPEPEFDVKNARLLDVLTPTDLRSAAKRAQSRIWHNVTAYGCRTRRRHVVYTMTVSVSRVGPPDSSSPPQLLRQGALHVVELAGSERIDKSQVQGKRLKEVQRVNCSLTCVGDVLAALAYRVKHIPYRNSALTKLLTSALTTRDVVHVFVHVPPELEHIQESVCSLRFMARLYDAAIASTQIDPSHRSKEKQKKKKTET